MLNLEKICVHYELGTSLERAILKNLSLTCAPGEFVVIMGGNGAGKSTLMNVILGAIQPLSGSISIDGRDVTHTPQCDKAHLVSIVLQDPKAGTLENMTLFENMAFAFQRGLSRGLTPFLNSARKALFIEKLQYLNMRLETRLDAPVSSLSGGQRQALSFIMALLADSKILLLDEITAALDPAASEIMMKGVAKIVAQEHRSCIMITHNIMHALTYGDRLLLLKNGTITETYTQTEKARLTPTDLMAKFEEI